MQIIQKQKELQLSSFQPLKNFVKIYPGKTVLDITRGEEIYSNKAAQHDVKSVYAFNICK